MEINDNEMYFLTQSYDRLRLRQEEDLMTAIHDTKVEVATVVRAVETIRLYLNQCEEMKQSHEFKGERDPAILSELLRIISELNALYNFFPSNIRYQKDVETVNGIVLKLQPPLVKKV